MKTYNYNDSIGRKIATCSRLIGNGLNKKFKDLNCPLTFEQWKIMTCLRPREGISQNELAVIVDKDHTLVSKLVSSLIKRKMLLRIPDPNDKRTNRVFLTQEGKEILQNLATEQVQVFLDSIVEDIPEHEVEIFSSVLDRIIKKTQ
ncbi:MULTISPECIES: MarR family winged helix-turn-helix transcriptional regulator [Bacillus]|uniref:HTH marR-type domain-containing protein n=1 Tax=Bacillus zhangzhouensis TaxID=1178540 RepID=A0A081L8B6_9BACI|nr:MULTISPECIES: MarR family transcriptional regulator [Bacillus]KEP25492.1 hypothetical protein BA70_08285 [Bacillus zhangzhouensis]